MRTPPLLTQGGFGAFPPVVAASHRLARTVGGRQNRLPANETRTGFTAALLPRTQVVSSAAEGLPPLQVEAAAFAWLAMKCVRGEKLALQSTTGARGARVLGAVYPA